MFHLDFLNKNLHRKYPLRDTAGNSLPTSLLCGAQFTTKKDYLDLFISRVYINQATFNCIVAAKLADSTISYVGFFTGEITQDYQTLPLESLNNFTSGKLIVGLKDTVLATQGFQLLTYDEGKIEDSLVTCFIPPTVSYIAHEDKKLVGNVAFALNNISESLNSSTIDLAVTDKDTVMVYNDKSALLGNCGTSAIYSINGVSPDDDGNIDLYGIEPVTITLSTGKIGLDTPGLALDDICDRTKQIPPLSEDSNYYTKLTEAPRPEWSTWPQYKDEA